MIRLILHHWAFHVYLAWMFVVVVVILWHKGHVGTFLNLWYKRLIHVTTSKMNAAATYQSENAVEDLRVISVKKRSTCPNGEETKGLSA
jgi:hypothetical protein